MKRSFLVVSFLALFIPLLFSQSPGDTSVYLITCGPGIETYSIYGHSALRVVISSRNSDIVYNWGVFDFETPNFTWKFAKGRLDYMLDTGSFKRFLPVYFYEQRYVMSQKINITLAETRKLAGLINENLRPENISYRYDFFYDDCSTRIRDLLEKSVGDRLLYPPPETGEVPTFRDLIGKCQDPFQWLKFGVDLLVGSRADIPAPFRDRMFLPLEMQKGLSEAVINRDGKMIPLLQNPEMILQFEPLTVKRSFVTNPSFVLTLLMILVIVLSGTVKRKIINRIIDISLFLIFSVLALFMIFFNFFTDHVQCSWNLNIVWLNPLIPVCFAMLVAGKGGFAWFRILFWITAAFLVLQFILPQEFNIAFLPLMIILLVRSSVRADFEWNPLSSREFL